MLRKKVIGKFESTLKAFTPSRTAKAATAMLFTLSLVILLRFALVQAPWIAVINAVIYYFDFFVLPFLCFLSLFLVSIPPEKDQKSKKLRPFMPFFGVFAFFIYWCVLALYLPNLLNIRLVPDYIISSIPSLAVILIYSIRLFSNHPSRKSRVIAKPLVLLVSIFLPYIAGFAGYFILLNQASAYSNPEQKVMFISSAAMNVTGNCGDNIIQKQSRATQDFIKFLVSGGGACGETSMFEKDAFSRAGFDVREVAFPGEDHSFIEVKMNDDWKVVDPGYGMTLVSRATRGSARVQEAGTVSCVVAYTDNAFVELTQQYVGTDTIIVRITRDEEPLACASVTFVHTLVTDNSARSQTLPGHGLAFYTDMNGTIAVHLGKIGPNTYNNSFAKTDSFYIVYVNGKPTQQKITSTGTGIETEVLIEID